MSAGPLSGVRIVDFTENMAGPFGTMILADQGADVIKVEAPGGDALRNNGTGSKGMSAYFANLNRSKRSICIDLRAEGAADVLGPLLDSADVVIHSFRPAAAARLGLDEASVRANRPRVIYAAIVGFGTDGPWAGRPVYDHVIQAVSGMADNQRLDDGDAPRMIRHGLVDKTTGHVLAQSVSAALFDRTRTGEGVGLTVVMLDVAISLLWPDGMMNHTAAEPEVQMAAAALTYQLTPTADGHISLVVLKKAQWAGLIESLGLAPGLPDKPRPGEILRAAKAAIRLLPTDQAVDILARYDIACGPVLSLDAMPDHPQVIANQTLVEYAHPVMGPIRQARPVPSFPGVNVQALLPAPMLGADTAGVLAEIDLSTARIDELVEAGVVGSRESEPSGP